MARKPNAAPPKSDLVIDDEIDKKNDTPVVVDNESPETVEQQANQNGAAEDSVESLRAQLDEANARLSSEQVAREAAERQLNTTQEEMVDTNLKVIENAINAAASDKKGILSEIASAKEAGDYAAEADALDRLQTVNIKMSRLNEGRAELERRNEEAKELAALDPVERYVQGMPPRSANWVRQHGEYVTDPDKRAELETAHYAALGNRHAPGSPQYFEFIETELGLRGQQQEQQVEETKPRTRQPPAAPPSRTQAPGGNGASANLPDGVQMLPNGTYRLSQARQEAARISGMSNGEYLQSLLTLQREGALH